MFKLDFNVSMDSIDALEIESVESLERRIDGSEQPVHTFSTCRIDKFILYVVIVCLCLLAWKDMQNVDGGTFIVMHLFIIYNIYMCDVCF